MLQFQIHMKILYIYRLMISRLFHFISRLNHIISYHKSTKSYHKSTHIIQSLVYNFLFANDKEGESYTHDDAYTQRE